MGQTQNNTKGTVGANDPGRSAEVDSVTDAHNVSPDFAGRTLGAYRVTQKIGDGDGGTVYRAERADGHCRAQVAVKILNAEGDFRPIAARFQIERQILARLNHPGIARVFDGGVTEEGRPYFVTERIEGQPIDQYCRERRLSLGARLRLFQQVCAAVDYAHRNLIVHRDLKTRNILVTADGRPKILDFGFADSECASPEQVRGENITTAADVYALGVVLYEILAGRHPYSDKADLRNAICAVEPTAPSVSDKALRGDVDNIVLTALRKAPERRYASASALSLDIGRHLAGRPISSRPETIPYRAGKFFRRHRVFCAVAALFVLSMAGGMAATLHEAQIARADRARAEQRFAEVRKVASGLLFDFDEAIEKLPGSRPARTLVAAKALEFLDNLAQDTRGDVSLLRDLATAYERVATLQGIAGGPNLGDSAAAAESLRKAVALRETVAGANPESVADGLALASAYGDYATNFLKSDAVRQQDYTHKALDIRERLYANHPHDVEATRALARGYWERSIGLCATADYQNCLEWRMRSLHLYDEAVSAQPTARNRRSVAMLHKYVAAPLQKLRDYGHALEHSRQAVAIDEAAVAAEPLNAGARRDLSFSYKSTAESLFDLDRTEEALTYARKALDIREQLAAADPSDADLHSAVGSAAALVGDTHLKLGHRVEAARCFRQALALLERVPNQSEEIHRLQSQLDKTR
jgi:tRNA A-37 threonylcarbamoyl transferase component Bud32/tetratricopeptide (TPR) repeat protein